MVDKPSKFLNWLVGNPDPDGAQTEPSEALKESGYVAGDTPDAKNFNYIFRLFDQWTQWGEQEIQFLIDNPTPGPSGPVGPQGPEGPQGPSGAPGVGVPIGGAAGQYLQKISSTDYDTQWDTIEGLAPSGGAAGQVLTKSSASSFDYAWSTPSGLPSGGTTGQALLKQSNADGDATWQTISQADPTYNTTNSYQKRLIVFDDFAPLFINNFSPTLGVIAISGASASYRSGMTPFGIGDVGWSITGNSQTGGFASTTEAIRITRRPASNQVYFAGLAVDVETRLQIFGTLPTTNFATMWFGLLNGGLNNALSTVTVTGHAGFGAGGGPSDIPVGLIGRFYFRRKNDGETTNTYTDLGAMDTNAHTARVRYLVNNDLTMTVTVWWDNVQVLNFPTHQIGTTADHFIWAGMASAGSGFVASWGVRFDWFRVITERP